MEKKKRGRPPKEKVPKEKITPERTPKGQFLPGNKEGKKFEMGNKAAEIWTEEAMITKLTQMWDTLVAGHDQTGGNYVRANDIKTIQEICIMHDVDPDLWAYFKEKFAAFPAVMRLIKKILYVLEARLIYSGQTMDIFVMKNHYGYRDRQDVDHTTKGDKMPAGPQLVTQIKVIHTNKEHGSAGKGDTKTDRPA